MTLKLLYGPSLWKTALLLGDSYGLFTSLHAWLGLFSTIGLEVWDRLSSILFVGLLCGLACLGWVFTRRGSSLRRVTLAVLLCAVVWGAMFMTTYVASTTWFADRAVQIAFFQRDYTYHGYKSVAAYLSAGDNARELIKLLLFSLAVSFSFQWCAAVAGTAAATLFRAKSTG